MPACLFPQEYEIGFVKNHLGPLLRQNGLSTKIWILDHNYNLWGRAICELDDEDLRKYCEAVAFHGYVGTAEMMDKVHEAHPDAHLYWTEGGPDYTSPDYATDWTNWGKTFTEASRHWCQALCGWNLALDEKGTEAAAATAVAMRAAGAMPQKKPREVHVDHPFFFAIQHRASGACLFLGRITDPHA